MPTKRQILQGSVVVGTLSLVGSVTGILVETAIAAKLGMSARSDVFYVAYTLPYVITTLLTASGQFSLVPFFASLEASGKSGDVARGFSYALNVGAAGLAVAAGFGAVAAPWLVEGIAPGLSPPERVISTQLARWLFFIIVPAGAAEVLRSFLLSRHSFALPSAAGFFRNIAVILWVALGFRRYGYFSLILGYFTGHFLQVAVLAVKIMVSFPVRYRPVVAGGGEPFRNLRGAGAAQLGVAAGWQVLVIVERIIASFLPAGALTALNWGLKIMSTMGELVAGSVGTSALPGLSRASARKEEAEQRRTFENTLEIALVLLTPLMVFCLELARPIIRLVFQRGNFTADATAGMASVFFCYSLSLLLYSALRILSFQLFARQEGALYFRISILQFALTVAFDLLYVGVLRWGAKGIPLALVTSLILTFGWAYRKDLCDLRLALDRAFRWFFAKNALGAALAAVAVAGLRLILPQPASGLGNFLYLVVTCGAGSAAFFVALVASKAISLADLRPAIGDSVEDPVEDPERSRRERSRREQC
jgi:putative peptidoglycan lipid II flippase